MSTTYAVIQLIELNIPGIDTKKSIDEKISRKHNKVTSIFTVAGTEAKLGHGVTFKFSEDGSFTDFATLNSAFDDLFSLSLTTGLYCVTIDATTVTLRTESCAIPALTFESAVPGKKVKLLCPLAFMVLANQESLG